MECECHTRKPPKQSRTSPKIRDRTTRHMAGYVLLSCGSVNGTLIRVLRFSARLNIMRWTTKHTQTIHSYYSLESVLEQSFRVCPMAHVTISGCEWMLSSDYVCTYINKPQRRKHTYTHTHTHTQTCIRQNHYRFRLLNKPPKEHATPYHITHSIPTQVN